MITVNDFPSLTDDLQSIFNEIAKRKVAENKGFSIFSVTDTERRTFDHLILHGIAGVKRVTPGQDLPRLTTEEGDSITWTQEYFGAIVPITKEMRKFDLYNQITEVAKSITEDSFDKVDQSMADKLLNGWATTYTDVYGDTVTSTGPDGLALFSASHTNNISSTTASNIITDGTNTNPALSREAIVHWRSVGKVHQDPNGIVRPIDYSILVVGPHLEDLADRIVNSEYLPGSANNDRNPLYKKVKIIVWERLAQTSSGTDTSAYWFMMDERGMKETLNCLFAERPSLDAPEQVYANKNWEYSLDYFYTLGFGYPIYVSGSKGDNS